MREENARQRRILSETLSQLNLNQEQQNMWLVGGQIGQRVRLSRVDSNNVSEFMRTQEQMQAAQ